MATSIDLSMLQQITFNDKQLLKDMLQQWLADAAQRKEIIRQCIRRQDERAYFKAVHQLKSNYQMIGCAEAVQLLDLMIKDKLPGAKKHWQSIESLQGEIEAQVKFFIKPIH